MGYKVQIKRSGAGQWGVSVPKPNGINRVGAIWQGSVWAAAETCGRAPISGRVERPFVEVPLPICNDGHYGRSLHVGQHVGGFIQVKRRFPAARDRSQIESYEAVIVWCRRELKAGISGGVSSICAVIGWRSRRRRPGITSRQM